ncbi:MAG: ATP-binding cassette domain-containing protein, partial [Pseudooceanicola nanhaiensis]
MTLLSVENLGFAYGRDRPVLDDISFTVPQGANVGLVGESGSGKSTLLRLLLGLESPQKGRILFDGAPLQARDRRYM